MYIVALITVAPKCPSVSEWMSKWRNAHTVDCYSAKKERKYGYMLQFR